MGQHQQDRLKTTPTTLRRRRATARSQNCGAVTVASGVFTAEPQATNIGFTRRERTPGARLHYRRGRPTPARGEDYAKYHRKNIQFTPVNPALAGASCGLKADLFSGHCAALPAEADQPRRPAGSPGHLESQKLLGSGRLRGVHRGISTPTCSPKGAGQPETSFHEPAIPHQA